MKRIPSRIPISVLNPYQSERERDMEYITGDKDRESAFAQKVDVRYLKNIKRFKNRIKSNYVSCFERSLPGNLNIGTYLPEY